MFHSNRGIARHTPGLWEEPTRFTYRAESQVVLNEQNHSVKIANRPPNARCTRRWGERACGCRSIRDQLEPWNDWPVRRPVVLGVFLKAIDDHDGFVIHLSGLAFAVVASRAQAQALMLLRRNRARIFAVALAAKLLAELSGRCSVRTDAKEARAKAGTQAKPEGEEDRDGRVVFHGCVDLIRDSLTITPYRVIVKLGSALVRIEGASRGVLPSETAAGRPSTHRCS